MHVGADGDKGVTLPGVLLAVIFLLNACQSSLGSLWRRNVVYNLPKKTNHICCKYVFCSALIYDVSNLLSGIASVERAVDNASTTAERCVVAVSEFAAATLTRPTLTNHCH